MSKRPVTQWFVLFLKHHTFRFFQEFYFWPFKESITQEAKSKSTFFVYFTSFGRIHSCLVFHFFEFLTITFQLNHSKRNSVSLGVLDSQQLFEWSLVELTLLQELQLWGNQQKCLIGTRIEVPIKGTKFAYHYTVIYIIKVTVCVCMCYL